MKYFTAFIALLTTQCACLSGDCSMIDLQEEICTLSATSFKDVKIKICGTHVGNFFVPAPTFPITIILVGADDDAALDGNGAGTTLTVAPFARVELKKLTIANGITSTNGGGIFNGGIMVIDHCHIIGNSAVQNGGGIYNSGDAPGGGIMNIYNSEIDHNTAGEYGGGIYNFGLAKFVVKDSEIEENSAGIDGGDIYNASTGMFLVHDSEVEHNVPNQII